MIKPKLQEEAIKLVISMYCTPKPENAPYLGGEPHIIWKRDYTDFLIAHYSKAD